MFKQTLIASFISLMLLTGCEAEKVDIFPSKSPDGITFSIETDEHGNTKRFETRIDGDQVTTRELTRPPEECVRQSNNYIMKYSPTGQKVYNMMENKADFEIWYNCEDQETSKITYLSTAIHESVHSLTASLDRYPLLDGRKLTKFDDEGLPPPNKVRKLFPKDHDLVATYLNPGEESATSNELFSYLLDELNAYTFDLKAIMELLPVDPSLKDSGQGSSFKDGTAALMSFTAAHLNRLKDSKHWASIEKQKHIIATIWTQAENILNEACRYPFLGGTEDQFIKILLEHQDGINKILGRKVRFNCYDK